MSKESNETDGIDMPPFPVSGNGEEFDVRGARSTAGKDGKSKDTASPNDLAVDSNGEKPILEKKKSTLGLFSRRKGSPSSPVRVCCYVVTCFRSI